MSYNISEAGDKRTVPCKVTQSGSVSSTEIWPHFHRGSLSDQVLPNHTWTYRTWLVFYISLFSNCYNKRYCTMLEIYHYYWIKAFLLLLDIILTYSGYFFTCMLPPSGIKQLCFAPKEPDVTQTNWIHNVWLTLHAIYITWGCGGTLAVNLFCNMSQPAVWHCQ